MADQRIPHSDTLADIADAFEQTISAVENSFIHVAYDHPEHGPHTLLSHYDRRYAGCRARECEPLYRQDEDIKNGWAKRCGRCAGFGVCPPIAETCADCGGTGKVA